MEISAFRLLFSTPVAYWLPMMRQKPTLLHKEIIDLQSHGRRDDSIFSLIFPILTDKAMLTIRLIFRKGWKGNEEGTYKFNRIVKRCVVRERRRRCAIVGVFRLRFGFVHGMKCTIKLDHPGNHCGKVGICHIERVIVVLDVPNLLNVMPPSICNLTIVVTVRCFHRFSLF